MKGEMHIKVTEHGFGIDMDFEDVGPVDKFELLHSVATGLQMSRSEVITYCQLERIGVFAKAESVTHCEDDAQLDAMLQGAGVGAGSQKKMTAEECLEEMRRIMAQMGG